MKSLSENPQFQPERIPDITDAALLMAADGYGNGKVVGSQDGEKRILRTSETKKSFPSDKEPDPRVLAQQAIAQFLQVSQERDMDH